MAKKIFQKDDKVLVSKKEGHLPFMGIVRELDAAGERVRVVLNDEACSAMLAGKHPGNLVGEWYSLAVVEAFSEAAMLRALFGNLVPIIE